MFNRVVELARHKPGLGLFVPDGNNSVGLAPLVDTNLG